MNIFEEYTKRKKALDEVKGFMLNVLRKHDINSIEIFQVLKVLDEHADLTQSEVANLTDVSLGTVGNIVLNLAKKGLITNEKDENDFSKRQIKRKLLNLTAQGLTVLKACLAELETE